MVFGGIYFQRSNTNTINIAARNISSLFTKETPTPLPTPLASIVVVGDIMLGRGVERLTDKVGRQYPFEKVQDFLDAFDGVFGNLEGPIPDKHKPTPHGGFSFSFPADIVQILRDNNFTYVSLGNNHSYDRGEAGLQATNRRLTEAEINHSGNAREVRDDSVTKFVVRGIPFTVLSYNTTWPTFDSKKAIAQVKDAALETERFIFVFIHWGQEYKLKSNAQQQKLAHELVDAGADIIIGAHPHVTQEVESYHGKPIIYSLGNFIFDQYFSKDVQEGLSVGLDIEATTAAVTLYPMQASKSQPELVGQPVVLNKYEWR